MKTFTGVVNEDFAVGSRVKVSIISCEGLRVEWFDRISGVTTPPGYIALYSGAWVMYQFVSPA